ncbi:2-succinyl-5-enolpyruvyl-6-hydroxy-3-cyclohexene-1-carboxylic-acid synthase [Bacillus salitolerans]|uniref:2-succinyl-5-enolpyruvyl-6-hydroxy-3-cyclohexene-1-carboxylate synthase n=1 Tax=Bacillus salitolerans TaxID=1437434 RepID=A0ABW4LVK0_9BACI
MNDSKALTDYLGTFIQELVFNGVEQVVISPGSRSTPFALLFTEHPSIKTWINIDERSAAFFALGLAKASTKPVVLLCTSGTAAANYYPAIIEATYSRVPLIVLTADRPHELRDVGAPQAINQLDLYGKYSKWFVEMGIPENSPGMLQYVKMVAARSVATSLSSPAGVVHLNFPFREPLVPNFEQLNWGLVNGRKNICASTSSVMSSEMIDILLEASRCERGIIVCGSHDQGGFPHAVVRLANMLGFPILADPLSQLRSGSHDMSSVIDCYDTILKSEKAFSALKPDVIIRFGAMPVSKVLTQFISQSLAKYHIVIDSDPDYRDPTLRANYFFHVNEHSFCDEAARILRDVETTTDYLTLWKKLNKLVKPVLLSELKEYMFEGDVIRTLAPVLENGTSLFVGNSMPIRDLDTFYFTNDKDVKIYANRGANGIDGIISTALGCSAHNERLILIVGDITFYHDLNGLLMSKLYNLPITIVIVNNNGGGIFSFLPQSKEKKHFEEVFGTPTNLDYEKVVDMYGGVFHRVKDWKEYQMAIKNSLDMNQLVVVEVPTENRDENVILHRNLWNEAVELVDQYLMEQLT